MKKISILFLLAGLFILFTVASCKKSVENKIDGKWRRVNVVNVSSDTFEDWEFDNGYLIVIQYTVNGSNIDTLTYSLGEYAVKAKLFKKTLSITKINYSTNPNFFDYVTDWTITKLSKKYLTISTTNFGGTPGGLEYREFTKQ